MRRRTDKTMFFMPLMYVFTFGGLHCAAYFTSRHAFSDGNTYTMKHYEFNSSFCQIFYKLWAMVWIAFNTLRPYTGMGCKMCCCFLDAVLWFIFGSIRTCILVYFIYDWPYRLFYNVFYTAWLLNWTNYWQS